jgi:hypothetical protein
MVTSKLLPTGHGGEYCPALNPRQMSPFADLLCLPCSSFSFADVWWIAGFTKFSGGLCEGKDCAAVGFFIVIAHWRHHA